MCVTVAVMMLTLSVVAGELPNSHDYDSCGGLAMEDKLERALNVFCREKLIKSRLSTENVEVIFNLMRGPLGALVNGDVSLVIGRQVNLFAYNLRENTLPRLAHLVLKEVFRDFVLFNWDKPKAGWDATEAIGRIKSFFVGNEQHEPWLQDAMQAVKNLSTSHPEIQALMYTMVQLLHLTHTGSGYHDSNFGLFLVGNRECIQEGVGKTPQDENAVMILEAYVDSALAYRSGMEVRLQELRRAQNFGSNLLAYDMRMGTTGKIAHFMLKRLFATAFMNDRGPDQIRAILDEIANTLTTGNLAIFAPYIEEARDLLWRYLERMPLVAIWNMIEERYRDRERGQTKGLARLETEIFDGAIAIAYGRSGNWFDMTFEAAMRGMVNYSSSKYLLALHCCDRENHGVMQAVSTMSRELMKQEPDNPLFKPYVLPAFIHRCQNMCDLYRLYRPVLRFDERIEVIARCSTTLSRENFSLIVKDIPEDTPFTERRLADEILRVEMILGRPNLHDGETSLVPLLHSYDGYNNISGTVISCLGLFRDLTVEARGSIAGIFGAIGDNAPIFITIQNGERLHGADRNELTGVKFQHLFCRNYIIEKAKKGEGFFRYCDMNISLWETRDLQLFKKVLHNCVVQQSLHDNNQGGGSYSISEKDPTIGYLTDCPSVIFPFVTEFTDGNSIRDIDSLGVGRTVRGMFIVLHPDEFEKLRLRICEARYEGGKDESIVALILNQPFNVVLSCLDLRESIDGVSLDKITVANLQTKRFISAPTVGEAFRDIPLLEKLFIGSRDEPAAPNPVAGLKRPGA
jgi:hypothetical protein